VIYDSKGLGVMSELTMMGAAADFEASISQPLKVLVRSTRKIN